MSSMQYQVSSLIQYRVSSQFNCVKWAAHTKLREAGFWGGRCKIHARGGHLTCFETPCQTLAAAASLDESRDSHRRSCIHIQCAVKYSLPIDSRCFVTCKTV